MSTSTAMSACQNPYFGFNSQQQLEYYFRVDTEVVLIEALTEYRTKHSSSSAMAANPIKAEKPEQKNELEERTASAASLKFSWENQPPVSIPQKGIRG